MNLQIGRRLFILLIASHPGRFRAEFGREMLLTYDEATEEFSEVWMLWDGWISLLRQFSATRLNSHEFLSEWKTAGLRSGVYPLVEPPQLTVGQLISATLLSAVLYGLIRPW